MRPYPTPGWPHLPNDALIYQPPITQKTLFATNMDVFAGCKSYIFTFPDAHISAISYQSICQNTVVQSPKNEYTGL